MSRHRYSLSEASGMATVETALPSGFGAPRIARAFLRAALQTWHLDRVGDVGDVVALLASELVNNAILHVGGAPTMRMTRSVSCIRVEVDDASGALPILEQPVDTMEHGRGLFLVASMANEWGYDLHVGGKTVWFDVCLPVVLAEVHRNGSS